MSIYLKKELKNGATVAVWKVEEAENELLRMLDLSEEEVEEIFLYKSEQLRREKLSVLALIKELFEEKMILGHHENGSPYLENDSTHISITHTDKFAAVIIHPTEDVGIDIESVTRDFSAVEKKALSPEEIEDLIELDSDDMDDKEKLLERNTQLAIYWCAKEALYKRMGRNVVDFSEDIEVSKFNVHNNGEIEATFKYPKSEHVTTDDEEEEFTLYYTILEGHALVWLVE